MEYDLLQWKGNIVRHNIDDKVLFMTVKPEAKNRNQHLLNRYFNEVEDVKKVHEYFVRFDFQVYVALK